VTSHQSKAALAPNWSASVSILPTSAIAKDASNLSAFLKGMSDNNKIGRFYLPTKSPDKNLSCVMQKSPDFVGQDRACSIFDDFVGQLFVYQTTNFVYVVMVIVYN